MVQQIGLFSSHEGTRAAPLKCQLLKWIGNKQRFAPDIISYFPSTMNRYFEPFLGSAAVLATLCPRDAIGSDTFKPLVDIFTTLQKDPDTLKMWYSERWHRFMALDREAAYENIRHSYNAQPNAADLLFISRSCYGGVIRFRKGDGHISTPIGAHRPISPEAFSHRVDIWQRRVAGVVFQCIDFEDAMNMAVAGDMVYCDPPYAHSQAILYGGQGFDLKRLLGVISGCKDRGVRVALSIDGTKRSGKTLCALPIPDGLFEREVFLGAERSMLKRFQMDGQSLEDEVVSDRLLLTY